MREFLGGQNILWPLLYIFRSQDPQSPGSTPRIFFTQSSSLFKTGPCRRNLFLCTTSITSSFRNRCLNSTQDSLSLNFTSHIHLITLISARCSASTVFLFNGHVAGTGNCMLNHSGFCGRISRDVAAMITAYTCKSFCTKLRLDHSTSSVATFTFYKPDDAFRAAQQTASKRWTYRIYNNEESLCKCFEVSSEPAAVIQSAFSFLQSLLFQGFILDDILTWCKMMTFWM